MAVAKNDFTANATANNYIGLAIVEIRKMKLASHVSKMYFRK